MKLCKDELIGKLASLFRDAEIDIDEAVKEAKRRVGLVRLGDFEKLFYSQIATLDVRNCPGEILEILKSGKPKVLDHVQSITIAEGNLAFAPVVTPLYLGYYGIVHVVRHADKFGGTKLDPQQIIDEEKVPFGLYYQFDIEDGTKYLGKKPEVSDKLIREEKRLRSTVEEIISIGIHTDVLSKHSVGAVGSRYISGRIPLLYLNSFKQPRLYWSYLDCADDCGAASCGSRLEL